ncbi:MAG: hypothetical protein PWQ91_799 [Eubacteriales bacterium]|nr:hypothetical protein [Eubacteriales bacterium]MDN5363738.1 hypothetical protein [Eubacteriales bacterium]
MSNRLSRRVINLYCLGEMGFILMMTLAVNYYAYFLTDVTLIGVAVAGVILLIARIADIISVPVTGIIVEKVGFRWGKYRTWLLIAPFTTALFFMLMFTNPPLPAAAKALLLGTIYILAHVSVNLAGSSFFALIPVIAREAEDRLTMSLRRAQVMSAGTFVAGLVTMPMIVWLGKGNEARGFFLTVTLFALLQVAGYLLSARVAKPFVGREEKGEKGTRTGTVKEMLAQVAVNRPLLILMLADMARYTVQFLVTSFGVYYFKYIARNIMMVSVFLTTLSAATLLGTLAGEYVSRALGKKKAYLAGMVVAVISLTGGWLVSGRPVAYILFSVLGFAGMAVAQSVTMALYADTAEYGRWKEGKDIAGLVMALSALPIKIGVALSGGVSSFALAAVGYVGNAKLTPELSKSISLIASLVPAFFALLALGAISFYKLKEEELLGLKEKVIYQKKGV